MQFPNQTLKLEKKVRKLNFLNFETIKIARKRPPYCLLEQTLERSR